MRLIAILILLCSLGSSSFSYALSKEEMPVSYKGRFRPADAYAKLWLYELYHAQELKKGALESKGLFPDSSLDFLWHLHFLGSSDSEETPLFWIQTADLKKKAGLDLLYSRFSYKELTEALYHNDQTSVQLFGPLALSQFLQLYTEPSNRSQTDYFELSKLAPGLWLGFENDGITVKASPDTVPWSYFSAGQLLASQARQNPKKLLAAHRSHTEELTTLLSNLQHFKELTGTVNKNEKAYDDAFQALKIKKIDPKEIEQNLEQRFPLMQRLRSAGSILKMLPSRYSSHEWFSLHALKVKVYHPVKNELSLVGNFTPFSDVEFQNIREKYLKWEHSYLNKEETSQFENEFWEILQKNYKTLLENPYQHAQGKALYYPSEIQLKLERFYYHYPLTNGLIIAYCLTSLLLVFALRFPSAGWKKAAYVALTLSFFLHTCVIALRCYILGRAPVTNMFETVLYVPWIAVLASLILYFFFRQLSLLLAASLVSICLLTLLYVTDLQHGLENVQAVLDSQFWLIIHVLLVVGSYGLFALGGILGHFYLGGWILYKKETTWMRSVAKIIVQTLYMGIALLIPGTILGGIWAAESWGRFWDWDPKESWAFISSCIYLIWIHAYRFNRISHFGLAVGAVTGLLAISFTWYGVNYILGTGLHSYGFGSGGEGLYYLFLIIELIFLCYALTIYYRSQNKRRVSKPL